ncbi:hypothetical protein Acy02nite_06600 [Actinoplanes cyaneus]|uniref:DUF72 domain-containing protein n=1 Tax=Actinoplanes cyaneus TaxID=52696 RepID=A0A919M4X8_9ACTN|nr:DUF72 domain-containing protein [Actinoplanes cyaneus]MCW2135856.1 Uncharacterized conserved protein YecE, DUF72 family [Actinoplanes cyaneus]GID62779.1 hypothetical protein Acy02nite_06600 [Actinoplanes cyaneus]
MGRIRIGTCGWTDKTLIESGWYPAAADNPEKRLAYYARQFPVVEVDSTYYGPPNERTTRLWADRTPDGFIFNIKAFSLLTGHPTRVSALYKDLRPETAKKNVYPHDLPPQTYEEVWSRFLTALDPLASVDKLGALLFQFPPWFGISRSNKEYLLEVTARCKPFRPVFEFRNASWFEGGNQGETLDFLRAHRLPYVAVDMPQGHKSSVPPVLEATADLAVVRFHGHSDKWTSKDIQEKFGYRYSDEELAEWAPKLRSLAAQANSTHVLMNNCLGDYAQRNATTLIDLLGETAESAPGS